MVRNDSEQSVDLDSRTDDAATEHSLASGDGAARQPARNPAAAVRWLANQFQTVVPERAERERDITESFEQSQSSIEQQYQRDKAELESRLKTTTDDALTKHHQTQQRLQRECDTAIAEADRMADLLRQESNDKARGNQQAAKKAHQESIWMAEAMFEANEAQPIDQYEQTRTTLETQMEALDSIETEAATRIRRYRQKIATAPAIARPLKQPDPVESGMQELAETFEQAQLHQQQLNRLFLPKLFVDIWPFIFILILASIGGGAAFGMLDAPIGQQLAIGIGGGAALGIALLLGFFFIARTQCTRTHQLLREDIATARELREYILERAAQYRDDRLHQLKKQRDEEVHSAGEKIDPVVDEIKRRHEAHLQRIDDKHVKQNRKIETHRQETLAESQTECDAVVAAARTEFDTAMQELQQQHDKALHDTESQYHQDFAQLERSWRNEMTATYAELTRVHDIAARAGRQWDAKSWPSRTPPAEQTASIQLGGFEIDINDVPGGVSSDPKLALPGPASFELPALLHVPGEASLFIETRHAEQRRTAMAIVQLAMSRLLTTLPPGKARFVILDPVALGQNFAGFMHLADYEGALIGQRIWTEQAHIQQRLVDLTEHMENVIQKYLRNEFESIAQYNEVAGEIAEPYRFLVVADFPTNFTDESAKRLISIVNSGARCGVHTIVHLDHRNEIPRGIDLEELRQSAATIICEDDTCTWNDPYLQNLTLHLDAPPDEQLLTTMMHDIGREALESTRVEVPFDAIVPDETDIWTRSAAREIRVPLGRSGASKIQELALGRDTAQHALIAGKTGSGKSTLLHVLITSLALWYRPDEVELYLVDFKKGVEFKTYGTHELPHAKVIAIESDREFGLSVLQKLDAEMRKRGDLYRDHGVQDVAGYRALDNAGPMPRVLLIIDEFQEFFTEDDRIAQEAALLLDRLVRQGRAFGMHVLLGSQTLGGAYSLARSTMGQMNIRIALQCSESDSYLIMNEDNAAARLLSRPGEAIYNDAAGMIEGNSPFQIVWLPDARREKALLRVQEKLRSDSFERDEPQVVFEGNTPGQIERNPALQTLLKANTWPSDSAAPQIWLGDAVAIKDPTAATLARHGGANLLIVGQRSETADCLITTGLLSLAAQRSPQRARFILLDGIGEDDLRVINPLDIAESLPHAVQTVRPREVGDMLSEIATEIRSRHEFSDASQTIAIFINGLHKFRALRHVDDFSFSMDEDKPPAPDKLLVEILRDGPEVGVHVIAWCDSVNNLNRMMERATQREFEMRVLMQMSAADSTAMIDSPEASRIGLQRTIFSSEDAGVLEKFRPYGPPDRLWLESALDQLRSRQ